MVLLLIVLVVSILCLVPGQPDMIVGLELAVTGLIAWVFTLRLDLRILRTTPEQYKKQFMWFTVLTEASVLPYIAAGGVILAGGGSIGLYWTVPAIIASFVTAVFDAWVLLVEINR
jgi:modulator of FtsH protease